MPYTNLPESDWERMDRCVEKVMAQGHDKKSAIAICRASITGKEAGGFVVLKQANGKYRWIARSTNAYLDRDGEIVSMKALEQDADRMNATGEYGPLRWWHMPGVDIGDCDFSVVHGKTRVESGTFRSPEVAKGVIRASPGLAISVGFTHPASEPDAEGVYHNIKVFERSLLPKNQAANPFTSVSVKELDMATLKEKWNEFVQSIFGGDEIKAKEFVTQTEDAQAALEAAGVKFKAKRLKADKPEEDEDEEDIEEEDDEEEEKADATPEEMDEEIEAEVKRGGHSGPAERAAMFYNLRASGKYDPDALSGRPGTKVGGKRVPNRQRTAFRKGRKKKEISALADLQPEEFLTMVKEAVGTVLAEQDAETVKQRNELKSSIDAIERRLAALEGDQPLAVRGAHVASADSGTIDIVETVKALNRMPADDRQKFAAFLFNSK